MTHRKLIEQMLEALDHFDDVDKMETAITAAKEYLAQPEQSEPVCKLLRWGEKGSSSESVSLFALAPLPPDGTLLYTHPAPPLRELSEFEVDELRYCSTTVSADKKSSAAIANAKEYLTQPEQSEPVAYEHVFPNETRMLSYVLSSAGFPPRYDAAQVNPLYTAPPQPTELTDEEILAAIRPLYTSDALARNALEISMDEYRAVLAAARKS